MLVKIMLLDVCLSSTNYSNRINHKSLKDFLFGLGLHFVVLLIVLVVMLVDLYLVVLLLGVVLLLLIGCSYSLSAYD